MYKEDLALNNLQWLICHKNKPNQIPFMKIVIVISFARECKLYPMLCT